MNLTLTHLGFVPENDVQEIANGNGISTGSIVTTINHWFQEQSQRTPDRIAISFGEQELSYFQLNAISDDLAHRLLSARVGLESRVGICLKRSPDLVSGILGILKAGAAYVPLDPEHPVQRLTYMVHDAGIETIICDEVTRSYFNDHESKLNLISISDTEQWSGHSKGSLLPVNVSSDNAAYVIYTSGSTGQPKGCVVTHGNVVRLFQSTEALFDFNQTDVWTLFHSFAFDFSVWEIWGALFYGGRLVVVPYEVSRSPDEFLDLLIREEVTVLNQTPSAFRHLIEAENSRSEQADSLRLRYVIFGGEGLDPRSLRGWVRRHGVERPQLINMYGITETTVHVTYRRITSEDVEHGGSPIGLPLADLQVYLLDPHGQPVPMGVSGEIYVGGEGLARGYLNRPELTAARFVTPPFDGCPSDRLYRSGDLARSNEDGSLDFLGRIDSQVKIRGHRIELGEIEAAILQQEFVAQTAVIARDDGTVGSVLVAYLVPRHEAKLDISIVRQSLALKLPRYMVPSFFVELETLPLTINGKLDTKALPLPQSPLLHREQAVVRPRNRVEEIIASAWSSILNSQTISIDDNFFELGGHSLLAMRLVSIVGKQLNREVLVRWVFENPTIQQLAQKLTGLEGNQDQLQAIPLVDRLQPLPLSFGQHSMWLVQALLPDKATYNQPIAFRISGRIDRTIVNQAIELIARRHESLRTAFVQSGDTLVQHICEPADFVVNRGAISLHQSVTDQRQQALQAALLDEARRPFDLAVSPLWRVLWIELADDDQVLVLTFHHSIIDEWSVRIFCRELSALYQSGGNLPSTSLPELPIQFADYSVWQRARQATDEWEQSLVYWKEQLAELPPALELPTDQVRPIQPSGQGAIHEFRLNAPLTSQLRQLARDESSTLFTLMLAVFNVWLARHTGQTDIIVGTPMADRDRPEVQSLMGYFLNTLPIRTRLEENPRFRRVLRQIHQTLRELGRNPIYQVMFVLLEQTVEELRFGETIGQPLWASTETSKNDLTLDIQATGTEWICRFEYATDRFGAEAVARMADHFIELLRSIAIDPDCVIDQLNLIGPEERQKILVEWNQTKRDYPRDKCLHHLFEEQVQRNPNAIAVEFEGQSLTYCDLNARANQLARMLRQNGVETDSLVGVCIERSFDLVVALLGVWKAGGAYVPLDPMNPPERLCYMVTDSDAKVVLTSVRQRHLFTETDRRSLCIDFDLSTFARENSEDPKIAVHPRDLAYVMYTSGSTGNPKGVMVTHSGLVNYAVWAAAEYSVSVGESVPVHSSIAFDLTVTALWVPLIAGGKVELLAEDIGGLNLLKALRRKKGRSLVKITPAHLALLAEQLGPTETAHLANLFVIGGENLSAESLQRWREEAPNTRLINEYGPTETVVGCCVHEVRPDDLRHGSVPIGRPIANTQLYVLDSQMNPVPPGVKGELYIGGTGVARGYWNRAELTKQKFVPDPFSGDTTARLYNSGDLARYRTDGTLEYLGRIDSQVKIRGFRVELGEIEAKLAERPAVHSSAVIVREASAGNKQIVGYLVLRQDHDVTAQHLLAELRKDLPEYMLPSQLVFLETMPLTPNGKVDREALSAIVYSPAEIMPDFVEPRNQLEISLAAIWCEILGLTRISCRENFFSLGGHSLSAMRVTAKVASLLGRDIPVRWMFEYPTILDLSERMNEVSDGGNQNTSIQPVGRQDQIPLSFSQHSMWLVQALLPDTATYHQPIAIRLTGRIDRTVVNQAIEQIARRHESLRTAFIQSGETLVQHICKPAEFVVNRREISLHLPTTELQHQALQTTLLDEVRQPFDLAVAPLWRVLWIELAEDDQVLALTFHHSIIDEWSMRIFCDELSALYQTAGNFQAASLPELPIQYADYASWQRARQATDEWEKSIAYWKDQLGDLPPALDLPIDKVRPMQLSGEGTIHEFRLSAHLTRQIRQLARSESTTLFTTMLAAFHVWLARHTGQTDLIVGTPLANRERPEVQPLIGYFLNTLPIRVRVDGELNFRSVLQQIHQAFWDGYTHAEIPFERLVELTVKQRELGRHPIYQVMFVLLEESVEELRLGDAIGRPLWAPTATSKNDLTLDIQATGDEWVCRLEYATDLFTQTSIERFAVHFVELLNSIVKDPDTQIGRLNIFDSDERHQIIRGRHQFQSFSPANLSIHKSFEEQVRRTPNAIAVTYQDESLSYSQLNCLANRLARELVENQTEFGSRVGICLERSLEMVVGILAILKAGAAYVPLDPRYPPDRLSYMIQDSEITVLICDATTSPMFANSPIPLSVIQASKDLTEVDFSPVEVSSDDAAYVIYTSGSTGQPKGCVVTHGNVVRLFQSTEALFGFNQIDVWTLFHSFAFDFSVWEIWGALFYGGRLVVVPYEVTRSPDEFLDLLIHEEVTVLNQTPSAFRHLIEAENSRSDQADLWRLRYVIFGGEGLDPRSLLGWVQRHGIDQPELINMYGITETTVHVTYHRISSQDVKQGGSPIGYPLADLQAYLLNPQGEPVPMGVPGEIYVGGAGLARGYLNRPELTAERFVKPPFDGCPSDRLYRSGDLARRNEDGSLDFLGRIDNQVKIRGHRIELGEIEAAILQLDFVAQAAVIARHDGLVGNVLVAYAVPQSGTTLDVAIVRHSLALKLPSYMVPSFFIVLETLPLTINGKLDIKALPLPQSPSLNREQSIVLPRNRVEEIIASAWSSVLNVQPISVDDNFFELGGHSLLAVRVVDAIKSSSDITIKVADLFRHATVAELAKSLSDSAQASKVSSRGQYLESIRPGNGNTHLVIVGAKLRVPLEMLSPEIPVWWLKLDGLHVWPPKHLDLPTQAAIDAQELSDAIPSGTILLCGHSYGGLLAIEIARQLTQAGQYDVKLILLEPSIPPKRNESIIERAAQKVRHYKKRFRLQLIQELALGLHKKTVGKISRLMISARQSVDQKIDTDDRWRFMEPFLIDQIRTYQLPDSIDHDVHLIKTDFYPPNCLVALNQITKGSFSVYTASEELDHLDLANARHSMIWMRIVQQSIAEIPVR